MENYSIPSCSKCNTPLVKKVGKNGIYYACPNWNKDGSGCEGEIWFPPKENPKKEIKKEVLPIERIVTKDDLNKLVAILRSDINQICVRLDNLEKKSVIYPNK